MRKQIYQRNRRLRVFGGPNGSGKSTILNDIDSKYDLGVYVNADEIEKELKSFQRILLSAYGIKDLSEHMFNNTLKKHSIIDKATKDGYPIDLFLEDRMIIIRISIVIHTKQHF